jgi:hypothetical protein
MRAERDATSFKPSASWPRNVPGELRIRMFELQAQIAVAQLPRRRPGRKTEEVRGRRKCDLLRPLSTSPPS